MKLFIPYLIFQLIFSFVSYAKEPLQFDHLFKANGLPDNSVSAIYKDSRGFMWFCSDGGLIRYDCYNFVTYNHNPADSTTISDDMVLSICEDRSGNFWVGTRNGLNLFDPVKNKFTQIKLDEKTEPNIQFNWVTKIIPCKAGGVWVASRSGLYRVISDTTYISWINKLNSGRFTYKFNGVKMLHYTSDPNDMNSLNDNGLSCLYEDKGGILWIGSDNEGNGHGALHKLLPGSGKDYPPVFRKYTYNINRPESTLGRYLMSIYEDRYGNLWIGSWQEGLYRFTPSTERIVRFYRPSGKMDPFGINCNNIYDVTEDNFGNLWIATYGGGLNQIEADKVNSDKPVFITHIDDPAIEKGLSYKDLKTLYSDEFDQLWIGSLGNGIFKTRLYNPYSVIRHDNNKPNTLSCDLVNFIFTDSNGEIWIASRDGILNQWNKETKRFVNYKIGKRKIIEGYDFPFITEYKNTILFAFETGIYKADTKTGTLTDFLKEIKLPDSLFKISRAYQAIYIDSAENLLISNSSFRVLARKNGASFDFRILPLPDFLSCFRDSKSNLWFSTRFDGLSTFTPSYDSIFSIKYQKPDYNSGYGFVETKDGMIWVSTSRGLMQYDLKTGEYRYYEEKDGLSSNDTYGILLDDHGFIWLSTNHGISRFDPNTKQFYNLDENDGLPIINFNKRAFCKGRDGEFYFGSDEGILTFHPDSIRFNNNAPKVYITDFKIFNKEVLVDEEIEGKVVLKKSISYSDGITLSYKSNVLQFEFTALNYLSPSENKYAFKMEGIDRDWNNVNSDRRFTVYAGLSPGEYVFRIKASNNDNIWNNEGASLKIMVLPPWWKTWWFITLSALLIVTFIIVLYLLRTYEIKKRNQELEIHVIERTRELESANRELETFAYSVSHDLRAPLRSIDGFSKMFIEVYYEKVDPQGKHYLDQVRKATQRMAQLIDDMLSLSRVSRVNISLQLVDLSELAKEISNNLKESQPERNVEVIIHEEIKVKGDRGLLRIVLENLIGNAWKFTSKHSKAVIEFGVLQLEGKQVYYVHDDGAGFDMNYAQKLFGAFQRLHDTNEFPGTGIGLATVQRIIHRHRGSVWAEGEVEKGATFYFTLNI